VPLTPRPGAAPDASRVLLSARAADPRGRRRGRRAGNAIAACGQEDFEDLLGASSRQVALTQ